MSYFSHFHNGDENMQELKFAFERNEISNFISKYHFIQKYFQLEELMCFENELSAFTIILLATSLSLFC
jgi:hypothetical protein